MLFILSAYFFKINFFKKFFQEHNQCIKWFGPRSGPTLSEVSLEIYEDADEKLHVRAH